LPHPPSPSPFGEGASSQEFLINQVILERRANFDMLAHDNYGINANTNISVEHYIPIGLVVRYIHGYYWSGILWQGYLMTYYQFSWISLKYNHSNHDFFSNGILGGAGFEIGFTPHLGIFTEYVNGYSPAFPSHTNIVSGNIRLGITLKL